MCPKTQEDSSAVRHTDEGKDGHIYGHGLPSQLLTNMKM